MKTKKNINENIDILGAKWKLAPGGREIVGKCQARIGDLHYEVAFQGAIFRNLNGTDFDVDELYGMSIYLLKLSKQLQRIHDLLQKVTIED